MHCLDGAIEKFMYFSRTEVGVNAFSLVGTKVKLQLSVNLYFFIQNYSKCVLAEKLLKLKIIIVTKSLR